VSKGQQLKHANISFYDSRFGRENITRDVPESDFVKCKFRVELDPSSSVVEIGCGTANIILSLDVNEKVGLDISLVNLMLAKQRSSELMLVQADAEHIPFRPGIFDAIIIIDLLHHVPSPHSLIKETAGILKVGGKLFVYDASIDGVMPIIPLAMLIQKISERIGSRIEHFGPSLNEVTRWLTETGFKIVNISGEGSFIRYVNAVLTSFSKRINFSLPLRLPISAIDHKVARLLEKFPIKFKVVAVRTHKSYEN